MRPPLVNSHSFMQTLTNQRLRTVSSWLQIYWISTVRKNVIKSKVVTLEGSLL